ncbi:MAG: VWA domain-containing protein [Treponema sp.]|nr:VWA domain-containing protein [Treponema sp.]
MKYENLRKHFRIFTLLFIFGFVFSSLAFAAKSKGPEKTVEAPEEATAAVIPQGRIIVLIVDISQSIKGQLDAIIDGLSNEIVEKKLQSGDYCVVVPLGDASNTEKADSFGVRFSSDKEKIKEYLNKIKSWMPHNLNTDIGAAMKKAYDYINMIDAENNGDMYEPLVLLITDGEIYQSPNSKDPVHYSTPESIFEDATMNPLVTSYQNWWFLGIENEGIPLEHIKSIAQKVGAFPDRYTTLSDMNQFGLLFDMWLSNIPDPSPKDKGNIAFSNVKIDGKALSQNPSSYSVVSTGASSISWEMKNTYERTTAVMQFKSVEAVFQNDDTGETEKITFVPEAGNLEFTPKSSRETRANVKFPALSGKGKLKLEIKADIQAASSSVAQEIPEYLFYVEFKSPAKILFEKILIPAIVLLVLIVAFVVSKILKATAPIKLKLEIVGKNNSKARSVSMRIHKKADFGSKTGVPFKMEGNAYPDVIGTLERTGSKSFKITPRNTALFAPGQEKNLEEYKLGTGIKLVLKDGSSVTIKFKK